MDKTQEMTPQFELEKQLHEQYAVNNNSKSGTLTSLIGSFLIVMTGYGYVLYQYFTGEHIADEFVQFVAIVAAAVMTLLYFICVYLGVDQRMEQFVTFAIRIKHYNLTNDMKEYRDVYPDKYHPCRKTFCNFVQGLYNLLSKALLLVVAFIIYSCLCFIECGRCFWIWGFVFVLAGVVYRLLKYRKYKRREAAFMERHPIIEALIRKEEKGEYCVCDLIAFAIMLTIVLYALGILFTHVFIPKPQKMDRSHKIEKVEMCCSNVENLTICE